MRDAHLSRRTLLFGGLGAAATAALAACGSDDAATPSTGSSGAAPGGGFPVTVQHQFGSTEVPAAPQRVVSLGWADADVLLALGVVPVGILDWFQAWPVGVGPWAQDRLGGAKPTVLKGPEINVDAVANLNPDLVTFTKSDNVKATYDLLSKLVPTISGPAGQPPYGTSLKDQTLLVAEALGRRAEGEKLVADTDAALAAAKTANPGFAGKTVAVAAAFNGQYGAYVRGDGRVQFMEALGFTNKPEIEALKPETFYANVSKEQVSLLDADLTVVFGIGQAEALSKDTVLNSIPSAKAGRLLVIDDADLANAFSTNSVLSTPYTIERFVPLVQKALA
ncbi:ABC transporter substrate-binding protein [Spirilliplanes yamanashiensis]|uniref:Iron siderophore-binding protein n=1 Tax=Spirilliplanes yamanashiensis TaxID=42233 RepID=A0A8J3Y9A2_9ACTN|nr:ABC transporter substrate-binding protein [Spirilliplanes yamanashiensis]MDP9815620.1 iron complex transport system substrate-binding protein [Spirilliplanes yamanashiensis]GIJ03874.1 iron siderophore-binding protein [Spirilliplanes yamanashiensis]